MLGRIVLKKKNISELEALIASLKSLPDGNIEMCVDAGFFDRDNPLFNSDFATPAEPATPKPAEPVKWWADGMRDRIRNEMKKANITGVELSRRVGASSTYMCKLLAGNISFTQEKANVILAAIDLYKEQAC